MSPASHFFFGRKPKNRFAKNVVKKHSRKIPRLFSDIRQSYLISFYRQYLSIPFVHAMNVIAHLSHAIMQAAPYSGTSSVRTISNDGCSTTFIVVDVAGEAADEAEEEASTVLPRRVVVVNANRPLPPPPWADAAAALRQGGVLPPKLNLGRRTS